METPEKATATHGEHTEELPALQASQNIRTTRYMVFFSFFIAMSGWMVNYDLGYGGTVLQMAPFRAAYGRCSMVPSPATGQLEEECVLSATAQSIVALSALFMAAGGAISGIIGNYLGRRGTIQVGCAIIIIGAAGQCGTAGNYVAYNVCKSISCVGLGNLNAGAPLYGVEVTTPQKRGALVSIYSIGLACGTLTAACICFGTSHIQNDWAWRTPVLLQIPLALVYGIGIQGFPESPLWLLTKGRTEEARRSFARFYDKDPQSEAITAQLREVELYIEVEKSRSSTTSWTELFHRSYVRRSLISLLVAVTAPFSGIPLVGSYAAVFLSANGVSQPFLIQVCLGVCGVVGAACGPGVVEYGGRRFAALFGFACMSVCMLIFSAVASATGESTLVARNVLVAFLCIWFFFYASCISSSHWLVAAEVHSIRLRTYGQAMAVMAANTATFASTFWTPYMINPGAGDMGTNVGYFYFGLDVAILVLLFFCLPETARLSLEMIDDYFASGRPARKTSITRNKKVARGELYDMPRDAHRSANLAEPELQPDGHL
ncbi:hypothetical protein LTR09_012924 [Extremus antarcticus]|uniref:Major facilitator superfamily (MFS) profile domain-containing protein n=1 Tax=Extremus antarcticus TaxID=702011 RepID=A0AAJ0G6P0_9PEZI|nr:hypothetical protein LTR09_012924 [Extremus antarcticus]